uniref:ribosomal protein L9 n=1 Tax=Dixoniella grisea TaxID=35153 RepID=UPI001FCE20A6|nr:ribosomal protein L9 [Dixoniella grisea]UNJ17195.1 ribosomal protein L9 [Dixoniella grisea]
MVKKTIQVLLRQDVSKLGKNGSIAKVSKGYARNYLLPNQIAVIATSNIIENAEKQALINAEKLKQEIEQAQLKKVFMDSIKKLTIKKKVGKDNLIFGSVSDKEIASLLLMKTGEVINKQNISIPEIKTTGIYNIIVQLYPSIISNLQLQVIPFITL